MYKKDLALNNLQWLIYHKSRPKSNQTETTNAIKQRNQTKPNQTKPNQACTEILQKFLFTLVIFEIVKF